MSKATGSGRRRRLLVPMSITVAGLAIASAAWACAPADDPRTQFQSCQQPPGARYACKPLLGTPAFPNATSIKGNAGARVTAFVESGMMPSGGFPVPNTPGSATPYDLVFVNKKQLAVGTNCQSGGTVISTTQARGTADGGIPPTMGTIPTNAPLGGGQVCFADGPRALSASRAASFKVIV